MTPEQMDTITALNERLVSGNDELLKVVATLSPEDQKLYLPKVQEIINQTIKTVKQ